MANGVLVDVVGRHCLQGQCLGQFLPLQFQPSWAHCRQQSQAASNLHCVDGAPQRGLQLATCSHPAVVLARHILCALCHPPHTSGLSSPTFNELWAVVAGNQFGPGSCAALAELNAQAAWLQASTGQQAGPSNNLTIASALWTQGSAVNPAFAGDMASMFKVCGCRGLQLHMDSLSAQYLRALCVH
jgi:hypothetical protein